MKGSPLRESFAVLVLCVVAALVFAAFTSQGVTWRLASSAACFTAAVTLTYLRLRLFGYPQIVGGVFVAALFTSPQVVAALVSADREVFHFSLVLTIWSVLPMIALWKNLGLIVWFAGYATALFAFGIRPPWLALTVTPEWHIVFAIASLVGLRHRSGDILTVCSLAIPALLMPTPMQQAMLAPLVAIGAGRLLYRGTLTKPIRIPAATWAITLLTIAAIRSAVIMVTWSPHWDAYKNRLGIWLDPL